MKYLIKTLLCLLIFSQLYAQGDPPTKGDKKQSTNWLTLKTTDQAPASDLAQNKTALYLQANDELTLYATQDDALGYRHYRYQQTYKGIPVEGAIYLMHEKNNRVQHANGKLVHDLDLSTNPALSEASALQAALAHVDATLYAWNDHTHEGSLKQVKNRTDATFYPSGELVILDPDFKQKAANHRLAYKFDIYAIEPLTRQIVYVDATNGTVLKTLEKIHDCTDTPASGTTNYSGNQSFTTCQIGGDYTLRNNISSDMQVFNANNTEGNPQIPFTDPDGFFEGDPTANEVHWATEKTYEYFLNTHGRNSLDGQGMALFSWIHFGTNYNNAFWNGSWMTYGDGDNNTFSALTAPDVVAHEMAHGVTDFSADLIYSYESGALNESFSDIFGEVAENYMRGTNDWLMGADFTVRTGKTSLRNMSNPNDPTALTQHPDTYLGDFWYSGAGDNGGVHFNSGVQNYWFYLLSEGGSGTNDNGDAFTVNAIGMAKAAAIAYRNLTVYLSANSQYADARIGSIQAATDLYGAGSDEVAQVTAAWCAVGVGSCSTPDPDPEPPSGSCDRQSDSLALVALYNSTNGANWTNTWDLNLPMDNWYGVVLNEFGCVTCLDFDGDENCGKITGESNNMSGTIPPEIGNLSHLTGLSMPNNQLSGELPRELGNLTRLKSLTLYQNELSGSLPNELASLNNLTWLWLQDNQFTGGIPAWIGDLDSLRTLRLFNNPNLGGNIPPEIGNLTKLIDLRLYWNQLTGNIPSSIGNLNNLTILSLFGNQLTGNIPSSIGNLNNLTYLGLQINQLNGSLPSQLSGLNNLESLHLDRNEFSGSLPHWLGNFNNLSILGIHDNDFSGCYPANLLELCAQLEDISNSNAAISNGNNFDAPWEDFCLNGSGSCDGSAPAPVWPGDFNTDGIADIQDLLYYGAAEGFTGATRPNASFAWTDQDCPDWSLSVNGINSKHQDGNGDGTVNTNDLLALIQNYGNTHNFAPLTYTTGAVQYRLELISSVPNGSTITNTYELYAESPSGVPVSTHGLACSIDFDDLPVSGVSVDVSNSSLMPDEHIDLYLNAENRLDLALTRTDQNNQTLNGSIASIVIDSENVQLGDPFEIHISNGNMMSADGSLTAVGNATFYGAFTGGTTITGNLSGNISAIHEACNTLGSAAAQVTGGTAPYTYAWSTGATTNTITNLPSGAYAVTVSDLAGLNITIPFNIIGQTPIYDTNGNLLCGSICPDYLAPSGVAPDGAYNASIMLDSDATVPTGDDVQFKAGQSIKLDKGFTVQPGASFSGEIDDCN